MIGRRTLWMRVRAIRARLGPGGKSGSDLGERRWRTSLEFSKGNSAPERLTRSSDDAHDRPVSVDALMRVAEAPAFFPARLSDTFLGGPSAQPALVVALSERHTPRAQDVVCGDGVEIEVGQRKRKDEGLRREG
jgi:hypothetical protein